MATLALKIAATRGTWELTLIDGQFAGADGGTGEMQLGAAFVITVGGD